MLIVFGGLPGAGKTTADRALARRLKAVHVRVGTIAGAAIVRCPRRVETRTADIEGHQPPTRQAVVGRHDESWDRQHIVIDTPVKGVDENMADLVAHLGL